LTDKADLCVLISAGAEWRALLPHYPAIKVERSHYGECFQTTIANQRVRFLHGGWGKIAAASSTQYAIDRWKPKRIINIGTCGGFKNLISLGQVILVKKTIVYDIYDRMTDQYQALERYSTTIDLSWLPQKALPQAVQVDKLLSADRDIDPRDIVTLIQKFGAVAADWESGAIAWVAQRNQIPCLLLRTVSDLVDSETSSAYGDYAHFENQCQDIMADFVYFLPDWITIFQPRSK